MLVVPLLGDVRYATSGNKGIENIQPFLYHFYDMSVGVCHNGNLINAQSLRRSLEALIKLPL